MIFDFWACGPAQNPKSKSGEVILRGAFPAGFLGRLKASLAVYWPSRWYQIMHVCAGSINPKEGIRIDKSDLFKPNILSDAENFAEKYYNRYKNPVKICIADPPYNDGKAKDYYKQNEKLNIIRMLKQMYAVTAPSGFIVLLDQTSPSTGQHIPGMKKVALIGVTSVPNVDVRLCTIWRKALK